MTRLGLAVSTLAVSLLAASTASAQLRHVFVVDQPSSAFTYTGNVSLFGISGPIIGQPTNGFNVQGTAEGDLTLVSGVPTTAQFVAGGSAGTVGDLDAIVPNPLPFLPPLATINVTGLAIEFVSLDPFTGLPASFSILPGGAFNATVGANVLSGTATVVALGTPTVIDLTGTSAPGAAVSGTLVSSATGFQVTIPINSAFAFSDPTTGASGSLSINGTVNADWRPLNSDLSSLSAGAGGTQSLILSTGGLFGGDIYLVMGSASGTAPGIPLGAHILPLNLDGFLNYTITNAGLPPLVNTFGLLDPLGRASAAIVVPPAPSLAGLSLSWAYAAANPGTLGVDMTSNAEPLTITP